MRVLLRVQSLLTILALLLVLCAVPPTVTAESGWTVLGTENPGTALAAESPRHNPADTAFVSAADNILPMDVYIHPPDSGSLREKPVNGYHPSFRETLLQNGFTLSKPGIRFPALPGYAGRIRCLDTVIAFNLGGNAPPLSTVAPNDN